MMEETFQKKLMLIKQMHQKIVIFVIIFFLDKGFKFEPYLCSDYHDLNQKAIFIMLLLFMLKEVITEFIFGTQQK